MSASSRTRVRQEHRTKDGVWGVIRVLESEVRFVVAGGAETILTPDRPGLVLPDQPHHVEPLGKMRMQVDFYDHAPDRFSPARSR